MLLKPRYGGSRSYNGAQYEASWPGVFDAETWNELQLVMKLRREMAPGQTRNARKYLLTGIAMCGSCGMSMTGTWVRDRKDPSIRRRVYCCRGQRDTGLVRRCGKVVRNAEALEHFIRESVFFRLDSPEMGSLLAASGDQADLRELLVERQSQQRRLDALIDGYALGLLSRSQLARAKATCEAELERIDGSIERMRKQALAVDRPPDETLRQTWATRDDEWRRALLGLLIKTITVNPGITKPYYFVDGKRYRFK
jgi:site-specific DNA recombinase